MSWQELALYVPAIAFIAVTGVIAWRVSKTGNSAARGAVQKPEAPVRGNVLAGR